MPIRVSSPTDETDKLFLKQIYVEGFKSIRQADIELDSLNLLIGANGAGKSNFIKLFEFLHRLIRRDLQTYVAQNGEAASFLYFGSKVTQQLRIELNFGKYQYRVVLAPTVEGALIFLEEYWNGPDTNNKTVSAGGTYKESALPTVQLSKVDFLQPTLNNVLGLLDSYRVYHFHDTSNFAKIKLTGDLHDNHYLHSDGSNLAGFLYLLRERHTSHYERIVKTIQRVASFFADFVLEPAEQNPETIFLQWREKGSDVPFRAHMLSDGTLRFICLATLLMQPTPPPTILIDEPELGLHPYAIELIGAMIKNASITSQIIISTQSASLVNQFEAENIIVVDRETEGTTFRRLSSDQIKDWLEDYSLGDVWEKNLIGGTP
jgi:predicted ATPase